MNTDGSYALNASEIHHILLGVKGCGFIVASLCSTCSNDVYGFTSHQQIRSYGDGASVDRFIQKTREAQSDS